MHPLALLIFPFYWNWMSGSVSDGCEKSFKQKMFVWTYLLIRIEEKNKTYRCSILAFQHFFSTLKDFLSFFTALRMTCVALSLYPRGGVLCQIQYCLWEILGWGIPYWDLSRNIRQDRLGIVCSSGNSWTMRLGVQFFQGKKSSFKQKMKGRRQVLM